ncbi:MAG TPA: DoxX family protein [Gemmatimonadaceae bacterium]|nr:DoxX family protein [Gemmatimonadaceae bacterium]
MDAPWPVRLGWVRVAELGLGLLFVCAGTVKLAGMPFMVALFASLGFGQWLRYVTALIELSGGVLLLSGRLEYVASLALSVIMVGATVASVVVFDRSPIPPLLTFILLVTLAWKRHPSDEGDPGR